MNGFVEKETPEPVVVQTSAHQALIGRANGAPPTAELATSRATDKVTIEQVRRDPEVISFIRSANEALRRIGYTEHGQRHAGLVGNIAANILERLSHGNTIHRENHALSGSLMAWHILSRMGMEPDECATIMNAIGNHEEERGLATNAVSAALIIADKSDVHRSRVQNTDMATFDIHDRVNYAATRSFVRVRAEDKVIALELQIDTEYAQVIEYFEIFLSRMTMVRQAVRFLGCEFQLIINDTRFS
jgi:metal-dependent HD superfamily phosphatase/phosphodiesterase